MNNNEFKDYSDTSETDENKEESDDKPKACWRYNTSIYCHSCGAGNHPSKKCKKKKPGHKNEATFKNLMGGYTDFCQMCTE